MVTVENEAKLKGEKSLVRKVLGELSFLRYDMNPLSLLYTYKGITPPRTFSYFFQNGGITGGELVVYSKKRLRKYRTGAWKTISKEQALMGVHQIRYAGDFASPTDKARGYKDIFCLAVMDLFPARRHILPGYEGRWKKEQPNGRQIVRWPHVKRIFMSQDYFDLVRVEYLKLMQEKHQNNIISWENFCKKVMIVSSQDDFEKKFGQFLGPRLRVIRPGSNLRREDRVLPSL